jgi:histidinol-phosphate aminotransferase
MNPLDKIKPAVRAISAYKLPPYRAAIKLNQNENPWDMPEQIKREVYRRVSDRPWSRYPDFNPSALLERLAQFAGWKPDGTLAGNGSNELIQATLMVTVGPGTRVILCEPTFTLYRQIITVLGGEVISVPLTPDFAYDVEAIHKAADRQADVIIICSPNNPTGCSIGDDALLGLASGFGGIVIVDEAYHEFSNHSVVPALKQTSNLIVLRTFSKAMSMAGLRVGYLLASTELAREVHKATLPYNLNFFSATAAQVACEYYELLRPRIEKIILERERLFGLLSQVDGVAAIPSAANFMIARTPIPPQKLFEEMIGRDILIRDVSKYPMLREYFRVSVGSPEQNERLIEALSEVVEKAG